MTTTVMTENGHPMVSGGPPPKPGTLTALFFTALEKFDKPDALMVKRGGVYQPVSHREIETRVLVTERLRPFEIDGQRIFQIGMPWHFGYKGYATGAIANELSSIVGDPNTTIHEGKALTCGLRKGRLREAVASDGDR